MVGLHHPVPALISGTTGLRAVPRDRSEDIVFRSPDVFSPPLVGVWVSVSLNRDGENGRQGGSASSVRVGDLGDDDTLTNEIRSGAFGESHWVDDLNAWAVESESIHLLSARAAALGWREGTFTSGEYVSLRLLEWSPAVMEGLGRCGVSCAIESMQGLALVRESELDEVMLVVAQAHRRA